MTRLAHACVACRAHALRLPVMLVRVPRASFKNSIICDVTDIKVAMALNQDGSGQSTPTTAAAVLQGVSWCNVAFGMMSHR